MTDRSCECGKILTSIGYCRWCGAVDPDPEPSSLVDQLVTALEDALSGWRYIRENHGDLYGVGWDRVEARASRALERAKEMHVEVSDAPVQSVERVWVGGAEFVPATKPS